MPLRALIFDVDGTLADTERDGHRVAFNAAFAEHGLDWHWDEALYGELLCVSGGVERIDHYACAHRRWPVADPCQRERLLRTLHACKTRHYVAHVAGGGVALRPGVERLLRAARAEGLRLAIATTTTRDNVIALLHSTLGAGAETWFAAIGTAQEVARKKPDPAVYLWVLQRLGLGAAEAIAFEDSANGLRAARAAGLTCIVTPTAYTAGEDFAAATVVLRDLAHAPHAPGAALTPADVRAWHARASAATG
jgi:beta-phosphoglucomutase-like phosphatase (HAD superfamily)